MQTITIDCFELTTPDGGGVSDIVLAYAATEMVAKAWKGQDPYKGFRKFKKSFRIIESVKDFEDLQRAEIRERALAKLSPQEREVLGL